MIQPQKTVLTGCTPKESQLAASAQFNQLPSKQPYEPSKNLFDYRIHISWFGGVQIHPKY
ncbi:MAG: hypothetical protein WA885_13065 [Phormidesmis sp.]